ncbi:MAG: hypothetical protein A2V93_00720 [Ignavibacteria bacterium RBG_16_34_14]|nr:MAG: hypothetical protein A2V93_00720 [Ignavibacteria bacterium RBG_16_34_14]
MKLIYIFIISLTYIINGYSQEGKVLSINFLSFYEDWKILNNRDFSELSNIFSLRYYPASNTDLLLNAKYAAVGGDVDDLNGFSDMQFLARHSLTDFNLSLNGGINIPSGKTKLNQEEFLTSQRISHDLFNLKTPGFGQGMNIFFGATWLNALSDNFVIGTGLSYQIKGEYQPLEDSPSKYNPSNEISITAGFDMKLNETSTLTGDLTGIFYGSDELDGEKIFSSGTRFISSILYKKYFGFDYLSVFALYRNIALDELKGIFAVLDNEKINPDQFYISLSYSQRLSSKVKLEYRLFSSIFEKTASPFSGYKIFGISVNPEFTISSHLKIPVFLKYSVGITSSESDLKNFELGAGLGLSF